MTGCFPFRRIRPSVEAFAVYPVPGASLSLPAPGTSFSSPVHASPASLRGETVRPWYFSSMSAPRPERFLLAAVLALGAVTLAGCASGTAPTSTMTPTDAVPSSSPAPSLATPSASSAPDSPAEGYGAFTAEGLVQICIDATRSAFADGTQFDTAGVRIERRTVEPEWLVLVPAQTSGLPGEAQCTIGGTPTNPDIGLSSASIERLPEEQIQKLIAGQNEGGDR